MARPAVPAARALEAADAGAEAHRPAVEIAAAARRSPRGQESYEDAQRIRLLTADARTPPTRLIIVDARAAITMTNELGQSRTLHPDGKEESIELEGVSFSVTCRRDEDQVIVDYRVDANREVRYTYSHQIDPARLVVDVQFLEHGSGDKEKLVFQPGLVTETSAPGTKPAVPTAPSAGQPAPGQPAHESFDQRPGAELRGLTTLGLLVEDSERAGDRVRFEPGGDRKCSLEASDRERPHRPRAIRTKTRTCT